MKASLVISCYTVPSEAGVYVTRFHLPISRECQGSRCNFTLKRDSCVQHFQPDPTVASVENLAGPSAIERGRKLGQVRISQGNACTVLVKRGNRRTGSRESMIEMEGESNTRVIMFLNYSKDWFFSLIIFFLIDWWIINQLQKLFDCWNLLNARIECFSVINIKINSI